MYSMDYKQVNRILFSKLRLLSLLKSFRFNIALSLENIKIFIVTKNFFLYFYLFYKNNLKEAKFLLKKIIIVNIFNLLIILVYKLFILTCLKELILSMSKL